MSPDQRDGEATTEDGGDGTGERDGADPERAAEGDDVDVVQKRLFVGGGDGGRGRGGKKNRGRGRGKGRGKK